MSFPIAVSRLNHHSSSFESKSASDLAISQVDAFPSDYSASNIMNAAFPISENDEAQSIIDRISQLRPVPKPDTERTTSPELFLKQLKLEQIPSIFTSNDIEQIYGMIDAHYMSYKISLYSLFVLEFSKYQQCLQVSGASFSLGIENSLVKSWQSWQCAFMQSLLAFISEDPAQLSDYDLKLRSESIKKMSRIPGVVRNLLVAGLGKQYDKASFDATIEPTLNEWEKCQKLLTKFFAHNESADLLCSTLENCPGVNEREILSLKEKGDAMKEASNQLHKYGTFINESINKFMDVLPKEAVSDISDFIGGMFENISYKIELLNDEINLLNFERTQDLTQIAAQSHELTVYLVDFFLLLFSVRSNPLNQKRFLVDDPHHFRNRLFDSSVFWIGEILRTLQSSILPVVDPLYKDTIAYEKRLMVNIIAITLKEFDKTTEVSVSNDTEVFKLLEKISNKFIKKITDLSSGAKPLVIWALRCKKLKFNALPFILKELREFTEELKPLIELVLKELSKIAKKHSDKLRGLPLLDMTAKIAQVFLIKHDMDILLEGESAWPCELPQEYLEFLSLEEIDESSDSSLSEEEDDDVEIPFPSSDFSFPETKEPSSSSSTFVPTSPTVPNSSNAKEPVSSERAERFDIKGISLRQLNRVLKKLGLKRVEGGRHAKWVDSHGQVLTMGPRHGKNPGRGLVKAMQEQVLENALQSENRRNAPQPVDHKSVSKMSASGQPLNPKKSRGHKTKRR